MNAIWWIRRNTQVKQTKSTEIRIRNVKQIKNNVIWWIRRNKHVKNQRQVGDKDKRA